MQLFTLMTVTLPYALYLSLSQTLTLSVFYFVIKHKGRKNTMSYPSAFLSRWKNTATASFPCCYLCLCVIQFKKYFLAFTGETSTKLVQLKQNLFLVSFAINLYFKKWIFGVLFFIQCYLYSLLFCFIFSLYIYFCRYCNIIININILKCVSYAFIFQ